MSRYLILILLNSPFVLLALLETITQYKLKRLSKKRAVMQTVFWAIVMSGLIFAEPLYNWLFTNNLTQTEPLSLFDVIQITAIVIVSYIANRCYVKIEMLERRSNDLHRELSIRLSKMQ